MAAYIRDIARSLYEVKRRLEKLEEAYAAQQPGEKRDFIERELFKTRAEHTKLKNILEGAKESPSHDQR